MAAEASRIAINESTPEDDFQVAARRLAQEVQQTQAALSYGKRGIKDVTEEFTAAANLLPPGQLVKDEYFTLFEAVGALEIMDPKMDSGYVPPGDTVDSDFDVCQGLAASEVVWIMDELLRLTIVWHDGYPLSQTLFTSLHVDRLLAPENKPPYPLSHGRKDIEGMSTEERLVHVTLRVFCIALIKSCALVQQMIQSQNFYEEEDFVTHLFGRELLPGIEVDDALNMVDEALSKIVTEDIAEDVQSALHQRLWFVRTKLYIEVRHSDDGGHLENVVDWHHLAQPQPAAFSDKVQRHLATSTPPRPMAAISWEEAAKRWTQIPLDIMATFAAPCAGSQNNPAGLRGVLWAYAYRDPPPNTFARARLQDYLFGSEQIYKAVTFFDLLLTDMRDLVLAGDALTDPHSFQVELPTDPRHRRSRLMETFMDQIFDEYMNIYRMLCQNRCRMRRWFTQSVAIWDGLERQAVDADAELAKITPAMMLSSGSDEGQTHLTPLTCWTKHYKLTVIRWTIQLGFETDIYLPHELSMMHWYLSTFADRHTMLLKQIELFVEARRKSLSPTHDPCQYAEILSSEDWLRSLRLQALATQLMSSALWRLYALLMAAGLIEPPQQDYAREQLLHDVRMKSYLGMICDTVPTLEDYKQAQDHTASVKSTCSKIDNAIAQAKGHLAELKKMSCDQVKYNMSEEYWKRDVKRLETTCVAVSVQVVQLRHVAGKYGVERPSKRLKELVEVSIPSPGSRYHDWWIVPKIKANKV
ncbi:N-alpha-acetyltransferase, non-catalitic subunit [Teratosphaeriaceae sp. CCFEE 6253]|nr:N-alpha-acetyltransferase, non-catalitic subunit [Teratosphaeriaceae sp. CCFEE 6253]